MKRNFALGAFALVLMVSFAARAQNDNGFSAQNFQLSPGHGGFLTVEGSDVPLGLGGGVGGFLSYQYKPLVLRNCEEFSSDGEACANFGDDEIALVKHMLTFDLYGSISLFRIFEFGVVLPIVVYQTGDDAPGGVVKSPDGAGGIGDLRLHLKWDLLHTFGYDGNFVGLALIPVITFPIGHAVNADSYLGDSSVTVHPKLAFGVNFARVRLGLNAGFLWRKPNDFQLATVGPRMTYGAAVEVFFTKRVSGIAELSGQTGMAADVTESPLEGDLAVRLRSAKGLVFTLGGGFGILAGIGTPVVRTFAGLAWEKPEKPDRDHDGIPDDEDKCPDDPEDEDDFQDDDGCPDPDNDNDGILDVNDECPNDPEDRDGFEDENGCPDPDNDKDGILDVNDQCPNDPEDKDGFEDSNGCPDPDNDADGFLDIDDRCPNKPENKNDFQDDDGCPDDKPAPQLAVVKEDQIIIMEQIHFETAKAIIKPESYPIVDAVAAIMSEHSTIQIRIEGHTDSRGKKAYNRDLSNRRAKAVLQYLVDKGISADRLTSRGFGPDEPIADNDTDEGRAKNRRVEFHITAR